MTATPKPTLDMEKYRKFIVTERKNGLGKTVHNYGISYYKSEDRNYFKVIEYAAIAEMQAQLDAARMLHLEIQNEMQADSCQMREELDKIRAENVKLREALERILNEGNMAAQGHWDATDKMKTIAYEALEAK